MEIEYHRRREARRNSHYHDDEPGEKLRKQFLRWGLFFFFFISDAERQVHARLECEEGGRSRVTGQSPRGRSETLTKYYATCAPGLEKVLAAELSSPLISAQEVEEGLAGVSFVGTKVTGYKANLWLRTAVRVLVQLAAGPLPLGRGRYDPVYTFIRDAVDWPSILVSSGDREGVVPQSFKFRNFVVQSRVWNCTDISSSEFATLRAKDAICDAVREACGGNRPEPPEKGIVVDVPLFLSLYRDTAVLYRDLSGVSLNKRCYRDVMHRASLNDGIAAACLTIAGWNQAVAGFGIPCADPGRF